MSDKHKDQRIQIAACRAALHPDLAPCYRGNIQMVHHPLVVAVLRNADDADIINSVYVHKLSSLATARKHGDWRTYIFLHERAYRFGALKKIILYGLAAQPTDYWSLVRAVWQDADFLYRDRSDWRKIWSSCDDRARPLVMNPHELEIYCGLPDKVTIHRGCHARGRNGFSWTLDRDIADWYRDRFNDGGNTLITLTVARTALVCFLNETKEREVIFLKPMRGNRISTG